MIRIRRFLRSRIWRIISVLLVLVLLFALMRLVITANYAIIFARQLSEQTTPDAASSLGNVYRYGQVAGALLLLILMAAIVELLYDRHLAGSFGAVTKVITRFAEGERSLRVPIRASAQHQVRALGQAFNSMAEAIQASIRDVEERDELRRRLVANIAHDLGTPLTSIQGYLERLLSKSESLAAAERKELLEIALKNSQVLSKLVRGLTELSRFDSATLAPADEKFSLVSLTSDIASRLSALAQEKNISLLIKRDKPISMVRGDINLIERVVSNLLDNAINYTPPQGEIKITFEQRDDSVQVSITDTGPGIPGQDIPHLCERFYRVGWERSKSAGGLGLGLAIASEILEAHGQTLSISSTVGEGSTFSFSLKKG